MWPNDLMAYFGGRVDLTRPVNDGLKITIWVRMYTKAIV